MAEQNAPGGGKKFSATIPIPSKLNLDDETCLEQSWKRFKRSWDNYEVASNLKAEPKEYRCAVLLAVVGDSAMEKFDGFKFEEGENEKDIDVVLKKFEDFCVSSTHEAFESYKFHVRCQEQSETIDAYVAELRKLAKGCNFGEQEDRMIRDRILVGCKSKAVQEKLLDDDTLTLKKAIVVARSHEASKHQMQELSKDSSVDRVAKGGKPRSKFQRETKNKFEKKRDQTKCTRCGRDKHKNPEDCRALHEECRACGRIGHFKDFCFT